MTLDDEDIEAIAAAVVKKLNLSLPPQKAPSGIDVFKARQLAQQLFNQPNPGRKHK